MSELDSRTAIGSWTVLVYIAANNELMRNGDESLEAIKLGGSSAVVRTAVQIDRSGNLGATRYVGENGAFSRSQQIGIVDTGNPQPLIEFLKWGISRCPAKHYFLVLWGHGAGLDQRTGGFTSGDTSAECLGSQSHPIELSGAEPAVSEIFDYPIEEILHDYETRHYLSNGCLRFALDKARQETGQTVDLLGLDACLMGMVEIVCEFRGSVLFAITSEDTEPKASWPYENILQALVSNPTLDPLELGKLIVSDYRTAFPTIERRRGLTLSLCDLGKATKLIEAVRNLCRALMSFVKTHGRSAIDRARGLAPRYDRAYVDLEGFCQALLAQLQAKANPEVVDSCKAVITALKGEFVVYSESVGQQVSHSNGISIFLPEDYEYTIKRRARTHLKQKDPHSGNVGAKAPTAMNLIQTSYKTLTFVRETGWSEFLLTYLGQKRKPVSDDLTRGGKMSPEPKAGRKGRKRPNSPRKKPNSPRKKPHLPKSE
jgi:Clostripain family